MTEKDVIYYRVWRKVIAKRVNHKGHYDDYLFKSGKWVRDEEHVIMDHLMGFDPTEPDDSPYRIGNTGILMEMDEISEEKAISSINHQILAVLKKEWKK